MKRLLFLVPVLLIAACASASTDPTQAINAQSSSGGGEGLFQTLVDLVLILLLVASVGGWMMLHGEDEAHSLRRLALAASFASLVLLVASLSMIIVPAGNIGVITAFGKIDNETLPPGLHFRAPFVNQVHMINTRVQPHAFAEIDAASAEYQSVKLTGVMNYHIDGQYAADLYQRVGDDFASKILDPAFNDYIKTVVPDYSITTILAKRDEIRQRAKADLQANLAQYHVIVDDIYIANIGFSPEYTAAIEAKQVAQQQVETEKQITQQRIQQAEQAKQQAIGQANALRETARGQADANDLVNQSLTPDLIQYTLIQKLGPDIKVMILPNGQQFILDPNALLAPTGGAQ